MWSFLSEIPRTIQISSNFKSSARILIISKFKISIPGSFSWPAGIFNTKSEKLLVNYVQGLFVRND